MFSTLPSRNYKYEHYYKGSRKMEIGGLVLQAFKVFAGNPDVIFIIISFAVLYSVVFTLIGIYERSKKAEE